MSTDTTPATVAAHATIETRLDTRNPILLGTFGTEADRRALVRLPDGAVETLAVGDVLQGAPVLAIDADFIALAEAGQARKLHMPGSAGADRTDAAPTATPGIKGFAVR